MSRKNLNEFGYNTKNSTYVIAEIGINHNGDLKQALDLVTSAAKTGCDAVKFQTYITEKRVPKAKNDLFDIIKQCELSHQDFKIIQEHSKSLNIEFFSTPFDTESIEFLESLDVPFFKVASFDVVNKSLLRDLAKTKKPVILSIGMANLHEVKEAHKILTANSKLTILHCVSSYPTFEGNANLAAIPKLVENFNDCVIGQSDHTSDIKIPLYAVAAGSQVIEKHYKISQESVCVDSEVSITEAQMKRFVNELDKLNVFLGDGKIDLDNCERGTLAFRRPTK